MKWRGRACAPWRLRCSLNASIRPLSIVTTPCTVRVVYLAHAIRSTSSLPIRSPKMDRAVAGRGRLILSPPLREGSSKSEGSCAGLARPQQTKLVGFRINQREIGHVVPFSIGQPNTIAAPGVAGLPLSHSRRVIDGPGHIPAIDLDGETVSRIAAWAAVFVLKGLDPIPSLVVESRKHLRRPRQTAGAWSMAVAANRTAAANSSDRLSIQPPGPERFPLRPLR